MPRSKGRPAASAIADRGRRAGIGHRHDEIGRRRLLAGELGADALADLVDAAPFDGRVRPGEIDVLEDAEAALRRREGEQALDAVLGHDHHLAGLHVAHEARADDVERAGLGGEDGGPVEIRRGPAGARRAHRGSRSSSWSTGRPATRRLRPCCSASTMRSTSRLRLDVAIRWRITSVSEVDWKIEPRRWSWSCRVSALVRLPLWATAKPPPENSANSGWMLRSIEPPWVE